MGSSVTDIPERFNAAGFLLDRHVREGRGTRVAFRAVGRSVTYGEIATRANRFGNALIARGVQIEQRVLLALSDRPEFAEAFWGAVKIGAVPVPVNPALGAEDLEFLLNDSRARVAVADGAAAGAILSARARCPWLGSLVVGEATGGALGYESLLAEASPVLEAADTHRDDVAFWGYTSGSTGRPKAAVHLQHDLVCAADLVGVGTFGIGPEDLVLSVSKLYFCYGLGNSLLFPARVGAASVLVPERPEPERIFELIQAERPTIFFTVPTVYARLLQVPEAAARLDLSSLRLVVPLGQALPASVLRPLQDPVGPPPL